MAPSKVNPCAVCDKSVRDNQRGIYCDCCTCWLHLKCTKMALVEYEALSTQNDCWYCQSCLQSIFPFNHLDDDDDFLNSVFAYAKSVNPNSYLLRNLPQLDILNKLTAVDRNIDPDKNLLNQNKHVSYFTDYELNEFISKAKCYDDSCLSVMHLNARSINKNIDNILILLQSLTVKFSVLAITETWIDETFNQSVPQIPGYSSLSKPRIGKKGGGLALYIKNDLKYKVVEFNDSARYSDFEFLFIDLTDRQARVGVIYRPPNTNIDSFNEQYNSMLHQAASTKKTVIITGDFNINLLNFEDHTGTEKFLENSFSNFLHPCITRPTRISPTTSTLIDNIFINNLTQNYLSGIIMSDISDHLPVFYILNEQNNSAKSCKVTKKLTKRVINDKNVNRFTELISTTQWNSLQLDTTDANIKYTNFSQQFTKLYNDCFPETSTSITYKSGFKPWLSSGLLTSIKKKNRLYKTWLHKKTDTALTKYKVYKNKLTSILRASEKLYYQNKFLDTKDDIRNTWKVIKSLIGNKNTYDKITELNINGTLINDESDIANKMNEYFVNIGPDLAKKIPKADGHYRDYLQTEKRPSKSLFFRPTDCNEIINIVNNLKTNKSPGFDGITAKTLKPVINLIAPPLSEIFNMSMETGVFPQSMKIAKVTPIFKAGDKTLPNNYRPISVLPIFSKILEKIVHERVMAFLNQNKLLNSNQYGFRNNHSTYMAIINLVDKISNEIDKGNSTIGIFLDLSKAFDTIDHNILIDKLNYFGIAGVANTWFKSYLENRSQFVQINHTKSKELRVRCGVPQGSILGPLLFIMYINDITHVSKMADLILFADDSNLFVSDKHVDKLVTLANNELAQLSKWFKLNKLSLNVKKTQFILFRSVKAKSFPITDIKIDKETIEQVQKSKFLGIIINETLSWNDHLQTAKLKAQKNIGILYRIRHLLSSCILSTLYYTLIHPYLEYCNIVWGIHRGTALTALFRCQKRAIRLITNSGIKTHSKPLFARARVLTLFDLNNLQVGCFMYRCLNGLLPDYYLSMFTVNSQIHSHNTRISSKIHICSHRLNIKRNTVRVFGPKLWNNLPSSIALSPNIFAFRKTYKNFLLSNPTFDA